MLSTFLLYSLKAALVLTLLYAPFTLLLQQEKFFRLNRMVLVGILLLSLALPLCNVSWLSLDHTPVVQTVQQQMVDVGVPVQMAEADIVVADLPADEAADSRVSWFMVLAVVYVIGMVAAIVMRLVQLGILSYALIYRNLWMKEQPDGTCICCRQGDFSPYSWMNSIVISQKDWNENRREIILHETGHILHRHSLDMLLLMFCQAVQWYNPFVWMLGNSLADVHEFEADDYVLRQGVEAKGYQMMLLRKAIGAGGYAFTNGLGSSKLKARIAMMQYPEYNLWRFARALYILPLMVLSLSIFATPRVTESIETTLVSLRQERMFNPKYAKYATTIVVLPDDSEPILPVVDKVPEFSRGKDALLSCLSSNIDYSRNLLELGLQGTIVMSYIVEKDGTLSDIRYVDHDFHLDETYSVRNRKLISAFEYAGIRAVQSTSGGWKPAEMNGEPVRARMFLPITFTIKNVEHTSFFSKSTRIISRYRFQFYI